jgi:hypothetical protein
MALQQGVERGGGAGRPSACGRPGEVRDDEGPHEGGTVALPAHARRRSDGLLVADFSRVLAGPLCTMTSATWAPTS